MILKTICVRCGIHLFLEIKDSASKVIKDKAQDELAYKAANHCVRLNRDR